MLHEQIIERRKFRAGNKEAFVTYNLTGRLADEKDRAFAEKCNQRAKETTGMTREAYQSILWFLQQEW